MLTVYFTVKAMPFIVVSIIGLVVAYFCPLVKK
jgi:hypothetical protein